MNDTVSSLVDCLIAKVEYENHGEKPPLWLLVKIEDLTERLVHCDRVDSE